MTNMNAKLDAIQARIEKLEHMLEKMEKRLSDATAQFSLSEINEQLDKLELAGAQVRSFSATGEYVDRHRDRVAAGNTNMTSSSSINDGGIGRQLRSATETNIETEVRQAKADLERLTEGCKDIIAFIQKTENDRARAKNRA